MFYIASVLHILSNSQESEIVLFFMFDSCFHSQSALQSEVGILISIGLYVISFFKYVMFMLSLKAV